MKILINGSNLSVGGGLTVGLGVVTSIYELYLEHKFVIVLPSDTSLYSFKTTQNIQIVRLNSFDDTVLGKIRLQNKLKKLVKKHKCDKILSLSNYAIASKLPQTLFLHWPYAVYAEKEIWEKMSFFNKWKRKVRLWKLNQTLSYANQLVVQTEVMKKRVEKSLHYSGSVEVIPSTSGFSGKEKNKMAHKVIAALKKEGNRLFLCLNEYYEHKNLEVLLELGSILKKENSNIRFIITLNPSKVSQRFITAIENKGLHDIILNVGRVERSETYELYDASDALFFPSLIESFGIPLVEAMEVGIPIYTSDRDFAHTVCGDYATYFDPLDVNDIFRKIKIEKKMEPIVGIPSWKDITLKLLDTL